MAAMCAVSCIYLTAMTNWHNQPQSGQTLILVHEMYSSTASKSDSPDVCVVVGKTKVLSRLSDVKRNHEYRWKEATLNSHLKQRSAALLQITAADAVRSFNSILTNPARPKSLEDSQTVSKAPLYDGALTATVFGFGGTTMPSAGVKEESDEFFGLDLTLI